MLNWIYHRIARKRYTQIQVILKRIDEYFETNKGKRLMFSSTWSNDDFFINSTQLEQEYIQMYISKYEDKYKATKESK